MYIFYNTSILSDICFVNIFSQSLTVPFCFPNKGNYHLIKSGAGEGNGTPLQYSCLENPMDGGAW